MNDVDIDIDLPVHFSVMQLKKYFACVDNVLGYLEQFPEDGIFYVPDTSYKGMRNIDFKIVFNETDKTLRVMISRKMTPYILNPLINSGNYGLVLVYVGNTEKIETVAAWERLKNEMSKKKLIELLDSKFIK